jgi:hypothetical protein
MRTTAKLMRSGMEDEDIIQSIVGDNLFQYPTERSLKSISKMCISRLKALNDNELVSGLATQPTDVAKQICLYAMMKENRLVWDFMLTVVADKYRQQNLTLTRMDLNMFFMRLQEQDDNVASWSDSTITKIKQVLTKTLVENEYLDNSRTETLNPVLISNILLNSIKASGDLSALPAFNYFE